MRNLIEIDHLALRIGHTPILHDVSVHVAPGEIYGLIGPNGAGKSTTIAAICGLLGGHQGTTRVMGQDPSTAPAAVRKKIGVLPEQNGLYDWMVAEDYLAFFAGLYGAELTACEVHDRVVQVGIAPRPRQRIGTFTRGMRQRLGLARALIGRPSVLVLDEPTNGLDPRGRRAVHDLLRELSHNHGVGILLCTHLLDDVERFCTKVGFLVGGRTVAEGPIVELVGADGCQTRYRLRLRAAPPDETSLPGPVRLVAHEGEWWIVDLDASATADEAWRALLFGGWPIVEVRREGGGLEGLYLTLTCGGTS